MEENLRVASDDILYRLQAEEKECADVIKRWRDSAHRGSIRDDDHVHGLVRDAAAEITRLRLILNECKRASD